MRVCDFVCCRDFPCADVVHARNVVSSVDLEPRSVRIVLVSEVPAADPGDDYLAPGDPLFARTTVQAFRDAGADVTSIEDVVALGVHLTTAVKCAKRGYGIDRRTIDACSHLLERELALFPSARACLLMGDVAIAALNRIALRAGVGRVIPAGATYRIRGGEYTFRGVRVFASYLQAGAAFSIEKQKRRMIAEDIAAALRIAQPADATPLGGLA
jgi:uracil-DNA glycosylase